MSSFMLMDVMWRIWVPHSYGTQYFQQERTGGEHNG
jgi:hypothetical protein